MKKKGLVYRATTLLGLTVIALQFGGELVYSKYFKASRDEELKDVMISNVECYIAKRR